jgi:hypothetical protein
MRMPAHSTHGSGDSHAAHQRLLSPFLHREQEGFRYRGALVPNSADAVDLVQQTALALGRTLTPRILIRPGLSRPAQAGSLGTRPIRGSSGVSVRKLRESRGAHRRRNASGALWLTSSCNQQDAATDPAYPPFLRRKPGRPSSVWAAGAALPSSGTTGRG